MVATGNPKMNKHIARSCSRCGKQFSGRDGNLCAFCELPDVSCVYCGEPVTQLPMLEVNGRRGHAGKESKRCTAIVADRHYRRTGLVYGAPLHPAT